MKVAPPSSLASGLMSLALLGLACDSAPTAETKAEVEAAPVGEAKLEFKPDAKPELRPETKTAEPKLEAKSELKPELATPPVEAATAPVVTAPPVPGAPGPAYFAVAKTGIVRLDGGKFTLLADSPGALVKGLQLGGDGRVWTAGFQDLMRHEGGGDDQAAPRPLTGLAHP